MTPENLSRFSGAGSVSRPLSANLRNSDTKADSKEEASAVIRAMQEENKKAEHFSRASSRPLPQPKVKVSAEVKNIYW